MDKAELRDQEADRPSDLQKPQQVDEPEAIGQGIREHRQVVVLHAGEMGGAREEEHDR